MMKLRTGDAAGSVKETQNQGASAFASCTGERKEIDELLMDKMPDYMDEKQRKKRIDNIIQNMRDDTIVNVGTRSIPKWVIKKD